MKHRAWWSENNAVLKVMGTVWTEARHQCEKAGVCLPDDPEEYGISDFKLEQLWAIREGLAPTPGKLS